MLLFFYLPLTLSLLIGVYAFYTDFKSLRISNICSLLIAALFVWAYGGLFLFQGSPEPLFSIYSHLWGAVILFVVTVFLFAIKAIGAGDSKLATAYALWVGLEGTAFFLFWMTVSGAVLGVAGLVIKKFKPFRNPAKGSWVAEIQAGKSKLPYGFAIFIGALASCIKLGYINF